MQTKLKELIERPGIQNQSSLYRKYLQFAQVIFTLKDKGLPTEIIININGEIDKLNSIADHDATLKSTIRKSQQNILKWVMKSNQLVPINYYRNMWLAVGMVAFGIPLGIIFGASLKNMAFLSIGFPIGMVIGIAVGMQLDKKAVKEDKQLAVEIKE